MSNHNTDMIVAEEAEARADQIFDALDDYSKWCLAQNGTAFTTYEDHGEEVCACLSRRARAWKCYQVTTGGFNCRQEQSA